MAASRTNGKPKGALPRLVPGQATKPRARREVNLPGIGASVVIEVPSVHAWQSAESIEGSLHDRNVVLAALSLVEPEMTGEQLAAAVKEWPASDWLLLGEALDEMLDVTEEALRSAQRDFRGTDN